MNIKHWLMMIAIVLIFVFIYPFISIVITHSEAQESMDELVSRYKIISVGFKITSAYIREPDVDVELVRLDIYTGEVMLLVVKRIDSRDKVYWREVDITPNNKEN